MVFHVGYAWFRVKRSTILMTLKVYQVLCSPLAFDEVFAKCASQFMKTMFVQTVISWQRLVANSGAARPIFNWKNLAVVRN